MNSLSNIMVQNYFINIASYSKIFSLYKIFFNEIKIHSMIKENIYQIDILFINVVAVTSTIFIMIYSTAVLPSSDYS